MEQKKKNIICSRKNKKSHSAKKKSHIKPKEDIAEKTNQDDKDAT